MSRKNDKDLEELLKSLPKIEDHRSPQEVYQNVSLKMKKRKHQVWILPSLASAVALLLFIFFVPNLMGWENLAGPSTDEITTAESEENAITEIQNQQDSQSMNVNESQPDLNDDDDETKIDKNPIVQEDYSAVYATNRTGFRMFTYPIPDRNAQIIVPVTVLAPADQSKSEFEQFEELMPLLNEEEWGLSDYYPLNAKFHLSEDKKTLTIDLPEDHMYGAGTAAETNFLSVISDTAAMQGIETIMFTTDGQPGVMLSHTGFVERMSISKQENRGYYFYNISDTEQKPYLVPSREPYENIEEALHAMKENIELENLQASIPHHFVIADVAEEGDLLVIHLDESSSLIDNDSILYAIEAILLTAKDFNFEKVRIENANLKRIGKFVFSEEWNVPEAPNGIMITE